MTLAPDDDDGGDNDSDDDEDKDDGNNDSVNEQRPRRTNVRVRTGGGAWLSGPTAHEAALQAEQEQMRKQEEASRHDDERQTQVNKQRPIVELLVRLMMTQN